jgi:hypothetical protein
VTEDGIRQVAIKVARYGSAIRAAGVQEYGVPAKRIRDNVLIMETTVPATPTAIDAHSAPFNWDTLPFNVLGFHCRALASHKLHPQFAADNARRPYESFKGGAAVLGIEEAIDLGAARPHQLGHARLGDALLFHLAGDLSRDHRFDSGGGDLLADAGFTKPTLESRTDMRIFPRHDSNSFNR